ncbi:MAG: hydroxymethylglutaryl-CoA reductase, degradative [Promethearchaeota archaeon]
MTNYHSNLSGFYNLSTNEKQQLISDLVDLSQDELKLIKNFGYMTPAKMDELIENVIGSYQLPYGIACNFKINEKDYLIPMVIEEPSVVAAASNAAKMARKLGGFHCEKVKSVMIAQIQIVKLENISRSKKIILEHKKEIINIANEQDPILIKLGGGAFDIEIRDLMTSRGPMLVLHLLVNVLDAMGANVVNTMAEAVAPFIEEIIDGNVVLRILSNLAVHRIAKCRAIFDEEMLGGSEVVEGIIDAYTLAQIDPYRAATHNKGIMNGIIALVMATGNDTRAIEAGAHAYASLKGKYSSMSKYKINSDGNLVGEIELPMALGIVGGLTKTHPMVRISLKILRIKSAEELSQVAVALGLAQNVAALRALVAEGIQHGHMKLHKRRQNK